jgi:hypothetical protein
MRSDIAGVVAAIIKCEQVSVGEKSYMVALVD